MRLRTALSRITKFKGGAKSGILQGVRFIPAQPGVHPARVYASDGSVGCILDCEPDDELPNAVVLGEFIDNVVKAGKEDPSFVDDGYGRVVASVGTFEQSVMGAPPSDFPSVPEMPPDWINVPLWSTVRSVAKFTGKKSDGGRAHVKFSPEGVEASDTVLIARAEVPGLGSGLVPVSMFKSWHAGDVRVAFWGGRMYAQRGDDELRFAELQRGSFPDLSKVVPTQHNGPRMVVPLDDFSRACTQAMKTSAHKAVELLLGPDGVVVKAYAKKKDDPQAKAVIASKTLQGGDECRAIVAGKGLCTLLKECKTPAVVLAYITPQTPVRVESGAFVGCAWQLSEVSP